MPVYMEGPREAEAASEPKLIKKCKRTQQGLVLAQSQKSNFIENVVLLLSGLGECGANRSRKSLYWWGLISGLSGSSAQCKCLGEQTEYLSGPMGSCDTWGWWAPRTCHPQLPLKAMALSGGTNYFRSAKKVRFLFKKDYIEKSQASSQSLERLWSKSSKPFLSTIKIRRSWRTGNRSYQKEIVLNWYDLFLWEKKVPLKKKW